MEDEEIKLNPLKDSDDSVPNPKVSKTPLDSLDSILDSYDTSYTNPYELDSEYTLNYDNPIFYIQNEHSDEPETETIMDEVHRTVQIPPLFEELTFDKSMQDIILHRIRHGMVNSYRLSFYIDLLSLEGNYGSLPSDSFELETLQTNCEALALGLQTNGLPHIPQCNGSPMEGFIEPKNDVYTHSNLLDLDHTVATELLESFIESNNNPSYITSWSLHPDIKKAQMCQFNRFKGQFYPLLVDRGVTLSEALLRHDKWLEKKGIKNANFAVVTWSNWDCQVVLESECRFKKIRKPPYFDRWINLKVPFCEVYGDAKCNLKEAVQMAGLSWQGRAHCGLDDAKNTARLLAVRMMHSKVS
ncbi:3'-5' exoribonuclease 1-like protein [Tanacetum coccineum]